MLLSINWLRDYLLKTDVKIEPRDLAEKLTMRGLSVSSIKRPSFGFENVVVGRIEKIEKHPNADRLQVTEVIIGESASSRLKIVCGAKNIAEGDMVPVALPGALLPGEFLIKLSTIRGVESHGMICSGKELGISDESEGILQLPKHAVIGEPLSRLLGHTSDDIIFEFELTPNRPDCLSIIGLAREAAPLLKTKLREPKPGRFRVSAHRTSSIIKVEVEDPEVCPRYVARVIDGLKVNESPDWIKQRLQTVGMRPVNNIVDITNFTMLEYGQPLHAFDLRKIESGTIRVATCKTQMQFTLLNNQTVMLEPGDILIQDGERPIALAGIMGGANSQIEPDTTSIVLESAGFSPQQIRRTAKRLGLISESSKRFEKGVDLMGVALASERAAGLLRDGFNANVYHPPIDTNEFGVKEHVMSVDMRDVRKITGIKNLGSEAVADLLEAVGISSQKKSVNVLAIRFPSFRLDLKESVDVIEEVARLAGYDSIPENFPAPNSAYDKVDETLYDFEQRVKHTLCHLGLSETIHYSFTSENNLAKYGLFDKDTSVIVQNPLNEDMRVMRTSLLPSMLETYVYNKNRHTFDQRLFELARTYVWDEAEETKVKETNYVSGLLSGKNVSGTWRGEWSDVDFYFVKGLVDMLVRSLSTVFLGYEPLKNHKMFHPNRSAILKLGLKEVGFLGEVHPHVRENILGTQEPVVLFELNLDALRKYEKTTTRYKVPSKFPAVEIDLAVVVEKPVTSYLISETIRAAGGNLLNQFSVFDHYEGKNIPEGKKSIAFHLSFVAPDRTLQDAEVNALKEKIVQALGEKHDAQLR